MTVDIQKQINLIHSTDLIIMNMNPILNMVINLHHRQYPLPKNVLIMMVGNIDSRQIMTIRKIMAMEHPIIGKDQDLNHHPTKIGTEKDESDQDRHQMIETMIEMNIITNLGIDHGVNRDIDHPQDLHINTGDPVIGANVNILIHRQTLKVRLMVILIPIIDIEGDINTNRNRNRDRGQEVTQVREIEKKDQGANRDIDHHQDRQRTKIKIDTDDLRVVLEAKVSPDQEAGVESVMKRG